ncbi:hypothetical protein D3C72_1752720 [compost metagenome]
MHSEAMAPISDSVGSRVEAGAFCPAFKVAAVMESQGKGDTRAGNGATEMEDHCAGVAAVE